MAPRSCLYCLTCLLISSRMVLIVEIKYANTPTVKRSMKVVKLTSMKVGPEVPISMTSAMLQ